MKISQEEYQQKRYEIVKRLMEIYISRPDAFHTTAKIETVVKTLLQIADELLLALYEDDDKKPLAEGYRLPQHES